MCSSCLPALKQPHLKEKIETSSYDLLGGLPSGGWRRVVAVQTISLPYTLPPLLVNPRHGSIKPAVGHKKNVCARTSIEYDFSGNNSCVNLGVLNGQWGYDLQPFISLVILEECDNEREQSYPHQASQHGKNCLTKIPWISWSDKQMTVMEFKCGSSSCGLSGCTQSLLFSYIHMQSLKHPQHECFFIRSHKVNSPIECFW